MSRDETKALSRELQTQASILFGLVTFLWVLEIIDLVIFRGSLNTYGIYPRTVIGLRGIVFAPFLHGNFIHLAANTLPFITLGWLVMLKETSDFFAVSAITMIVSGLGVWLFGSTSFHIGASGVIFGYLGFLLFRGLFERNVISIIISLIVGFFYGGLIWGVLPTQPGVSWEGHLFGLVGGVIAAKMLSRHSVK
jgi:membrane associated rhomboid family serine protease